MRNASLFLTAVGILAIAGCAQEKGFEVTGTMSPAQVRAAESGERRPEPVFPSPNRPVSPPPAYEAPPARRRVQEQPAAASNTSTEPTKVTVVPDTALGGKVVSINANLRFVVLNFPVGRMAPIEKTLNVYRQGQKVGEVKVTGPQQDDNIIADITNGEAAAGDEVREN